MLAVYFGELYCTVRSRTTRGLYTWKSLLLEQRRLIVNTEPRSSFVSMLWAALPVLAGVDVEFVRADARSWSSSHGNDGHKVKGFTVDTLIRVSS